MKSSRTDESQEFFVSEWKRFFFLLKLLLNRSNRWIFDLLTIPNQIVNHPIFYQIIDTGCTEILELNYTFSKIFRIDGSSIYYQIKL